jgi:hypothetical protein
MLPANASTVAKFISDIIIQNTLCLRAFAALILATPSAFSNRARLASARTYTKQHRKRRAGQSSVQSHRPDFAPRNK